MSPLDLLVGIVRRTRGHRVVLATVAVAIALTSAVVTGVPRVLNHLSDSSLQHVLSTTPPPQRGVTVTAGGAIPAGSPGTGALGRVRVRGEEYLRELPSTLQEHLTPPATRVTTSRWPASPWPGDQPSNPTWVSFHVVPGITDHAELTDGRWPQRTRQTVPVDPPVLGRSEVDVLEIAVSDATAATLDWSPGTDVLLEMNQQDVFRLGRGLAGRRPLVARIVGVFAPTPVDQDPFWWQDTQLHVPGVEPTLSATIFTTHGVVADDAYVDLADTTEPFLLTYRWQADLQRQEVTPSSVAGLREAAARTVAQPLPRVGAEQQRASVSTALDRVLARHEGRLAAAQDTLGVGVFGLLALALVVVATAGVLLVGRRAPSTLLLRGRGASRRQVLGLVVGEAIVLAAGSTLIGAAVVVATVTGRTDARSLVVPSILAIGVTIVLTIVTLPLLRGSPGRARTERVATRRSQRGRITAEALTIAAAAGAVSLSRARASVEGGFDVVLGAAPVLLVAAATIVVVRATTLLLRAAAPLVRRWRGLSGPVLVRAGARDADRFIPPLVVLLIGAAVATFSAATVDGVRDGQIQSAYASVGAAHRLEADDGLGALTVDALGDAAPVVTVHAQRVPTRRAGGASLGAATLVAVEGDVGALVDATPGGVRLPGRWRVPRVSDGVVAVASSRFLARNDLRVGDRLTVGDAGTAVTVVGAGSHALGFDRDDAWLVVHRSQLPDADGLVPTLALVGPGGPDAATIDRIATEHGMTLVQHAEEVLAAERAVPLARGVLRGAGLVTAVAGVFALVGLVVGLVVLRRREAWELALLRTVGTPGRELRRVVRGRLSAIIGLGSIGGLALGLLASRVLRPAMHLDTLTGAPGPTQLLGPVTVVSFLAITTTCVLLAAGQLVRSRTIDPLPELRRSEP